MSTSNITLNDRCNIPLHCKCKIVVTKSLQRWIIIEATSFSLTSKIFFQEILAEPLRQNILHSSYVSWRLRGLLGFVSVSNDFWGRFNVGIYIYLLRVASVNNTNKESFMTSYGEQRTHTICKCLYNSCKFYNTDNTYAFQ